MAFLALGEVLNLAVAGRGVTLLLLMPHAVILARALFQFDLISFRAYVASSPPRATSNTWPGYRRLAFESGISRVGSNGMPLSLSGDISCSEICGAPVAKSL